MRQNVSHQDIMEALQNTAQQYNAKNMAEKLKKASSTFYAELNPYTLDVDDEDRKVPRHKLGLKDALSIMEISGDYEALRLICASQGFALQPLNCEPVMAVVAFQNFTDVTIELGEFAQELKKALADGLLDRDERVALAREAQDIVDTLTPFLTLK